MALLSSMLLLLACGKKQKQNHCDMLCEVSEFTLETPIDGSLPTEALTFKTNLSLINFDLLQREKILAAAEIIERVIATEEFRSRVLNHTLNGVKTFANNNGLNNKQIYDRILLGAEKLFPVKNNAMDVEIELIFENSTTIGYTYPNSTRIWMNLKYFNNYTPRDIATNLMHEWLHKLGFDHSTSQTAERSSSVPYAIGYMVKSLAPLVENH
jgi:hypothetical protein